MKTIIASTFVFAVLTIAAVPKDFAIKRDVVNGKKLYTANCVSCHGKTGLGNGIAGLALKPPPASFADVVRFKDVSDLELFVAVKQGGPAVKLSPAMPPWGTAMKDAEIQDVLAYVKSTFIEPARKAAAKP